MGGCDVHHRQQPAVRRAGERATVNPVRIRCGVAQAHRVPGLGVQSAGRRARQVHGVLCKKIERCARALVWKGPTQRCRRHPGRTQHVQAEHRQATALGQWQRELHHRAGLGHAGYASQYGVQVFIKTARLRGLHLQVCSPVDGLHGAGKLIQRRAVDQMHRVAQRHANGDCQRSGQPARGVSAQFGCRHPAQGQRLPPRCRRQRLRQPHLPLKRHGGHAGRARSAAARGRPRLPRVRNG